MKGEEAGEIRLDLADELAEVGDIKRLTGERGILVGQGYELSVVPGNDVRWSLQLKRIVGGVEISGTMEGRVELGCTRCLERYAHEMHLKIKEHALWLSERDVKPGDDYGGEYLVVEGVLDLFPVFRDVLCLSFPTRRVCSDACRGLCPVCGANLNLGTCGCDPKKVDARLKPLGELKKRLEEKNGSGT